MVELRLKFNPTDIVQGSQRAEGALDDVGDQALKTESAIDKMSKRGGKSMDVLTSKTKALAKIATVTAVAFAVKGVVAFREYDAALSEVSTLIEGTEEEMAFLDETSKRLSEQFGGTATAQAQAFYQAISAGAGNAAQSAKFLETANKLAVGGVADITTAVDVLTGSVNAYGPAVLSAVEASDILFTGVKLGKTTIRELGASLGDIVPIAESVGVSFEETVSAVAALTTVGIGTSKAVTGIRSALSNVLKPTKEAADLAKSLGLEFDVAALKSKGLSGFLEDVNDKTNGSQVAMAKLFGSVEALGAVIALTGGASAKFTETLVAMETASGATQTAFDKIDKSLGQRLNVQLSKFGSAALTVGKSVLTLLVPAMERFTSTVEFLVLAFGDGIPRITSFGDATNQLVVAMGDEINQSNQLQIALGQSTTMSVDAAKKKLQEASSRFENVKAIIAESRALAVNSEENEKISQQFRDVQTALRTTSTRATADDAREGLELILVDLHAQRAALLATDKALSDQLKTTIENMERIKAGISDASDGVVVFGDNIVKPIGLSDKLADSVSKVPKSVKKAKEEMSDFQRVGGSAIDSLIEGTGNLRDVLKEVILEFGRAIIKKKLLGSVSGGTASDSIGGLIFKGVFGGLFDNGGVIGSGQSGIVGERGPERVTATSRGAVVTSRVDTGAVARSQPGAQAQHITIGVSFDGDAGFRAFVKNVSNRAATGARRGAVNDVKSGLPAWQQQLNNDGALI